MHFAKFLDIIEEPDKHNGIFYIQKQNSNLTEEFPELLDGVPADIPWMSEALNKTPDAINFWMGDGRAVTSLHKDHYENVYFVISGYKDILLLPPGARPWIPHRFYPTATYAEEGGRFELRPDSEGEPVPWADWAPPAEGQEVPPGQPRPVHCRLHAGDMLYLPSLWFHHLRQSHGCIAVNYWYDMEFDVKYCYFKFLESLSTATVDK
ncbi:bifunctional peptidase and (3S)-lysyl hydroxylase Jmjd7-like isoform X2 [Amphibalanus amphitrite]|nr:bifunctional peptidase and (3S)-lysyl hydroxylase Jmjd7-like isoform X2 [Amphibalanus amphitrite]XP_043247404.1 bifunctional peptidase and (3S)-lysyl hydroxylase Jmjd7-like isoform X2 [Amphibalanus amphitrite]